LLGKIVKKESRGTLFGTFSLIGSTGVLIINSLGGYLFDNVSNKWPFLLTIIAYSVHTAMIIVLALLRKLHH
jgi:MFS family permease